MWRQHVYVLLSVCLLLRLYSASLGIYSFIGSYIHKHTHTHTHTHTDTVNSRFRQRPQKVVAGAIYTTLCNLSCLFLCHCFNLCLRPYGSACLSVRCSPI